MGGAGAGFAMDLPWPVAVAACFLGIKRDLTAGRSGPRGNEDCRYVPFEVSP